MPSAPRPNHTRLSVETLEDRTTPTFLPRPGGPLGQQINVNGANVPTGGLSIAAGELVPDDTFAAFGFATNEYVTGTGPGTQALVRIHSTDGTLIRQFAPFGNFRGGINVAVGRVIATPTPPISGIIAPPPEQQIVVSVAGNGPPHVKVFSATGRQLASFMAFDTGFAGGVNIAVGHVLGAVPSGLFSNDPANADIPQQIVIGAASGGSPHVVVADAATGSVLRSFLAFDLGYRGGVTVAAADLDAGPTLDVINGNATTDTNLYDEIVVGSALGAGHVKAFGVFTGAIDERLSFFAFDPGATNGVTLAAGNTAGERGAQIFAGQVGSASPALRVYDGGGGLILQVNPFPPLYTQVMNMTVATLGIFGSGGIYDPGFSPDFYSQDLAIVTGDGPFGQQPRFYRGFAFGIPAGGFGP